MVTAAVAALVTHPQTGTRVLHKVGKQNLRYPDKILGSWGACSMNVKVADAAFVKPQETGPKLVSIIIAMAGLNYASFEVSPGNHENQARGCRAAPITPPNIGPMVWSANLRSCSGIFLP